MIKSLHIKNFVIIEEYSLDFSNGLNIITGETGSGKSLVFKALNIILGDRASSELVRKGEKKSIIEARFSVVNVNDILINLVDPDFFDITDEIIIRREFTSSGQSRSFLNDSQVSVSELKKIKSQLLDYHGQHSTSRILDEKYQLQVL
ncbi:AAA family ATPase, partial [Candidatus Kapabacteria bacterium]|nr:AAA family ATPase [Candidatus Kapabacteria bacterium]